jgi:hypothetical protein
MWTRFRGTTCTPKGAKPGCFEANPVFASMALPHDCLFETTDLYVESHVKRFAPCRFSFVNTRRRLSILALTKRKTAIPATTKLQSGRIVCLR